MTCEAHNTNKAADGRAVMNAINLPSLLLLFLFISPISAVCCEPAHMGRDTAASRGYVVPQQAANATFSHMVLCRCLQCVMLPLNHRYQTFGIKEATAIVHRDRWGRAFPSEAGPGWDELWDRRPYPWDPVAAPVFQLQGPPAAPAPILNLPGAAAAAAAAPAVDPQGEDQPMGADDPAIQPPPHPPHPPHACAHGAAPAAAAPPAPPNIPAAPAGERTERTRCWRMSCG